jgi:hypothetical protein
VRTRALASSRSGGQLPENPGFCRLTSPRSPSATRRPSSPMR